MHEIDALNYKHYSLEEGDTETNPPELLSLGSISIDRDRETRVLNKVFLLATSGRSNPSSPNPQTKFLKVKNQLTIPVGLLYYMQNFSSMLAKLKDVCMYVRTYVCTYYVQAYRETHIFIYL